MSLKFLYLSYFFMKYGYLSFLFHCFYCLIFHGINPHINFYDCRFQWCQVLLPLPNRSIHSALCSLVVPSVAYTLCVVSSVVHPETSPTCADALPPELRRNVQIPTSLFPQIREPSFGKKMMDENLHYRNKWLCMYLFGIHHRTWLSACWKYPRLPQLKRDVRLTKYSDILFSNSQLNSFNICRRKAGSLSDLFYNFVESRWFRSIRCGGYNGCSSSSSFEDGFLRKSYFAYMSFLLWVNVAKNAFWKAF